MSDKPRTSWQSRFTTLLLFGSVAVGFLLRFFIGPGLLPFGIAAGGALISYLLPPPGARVPPMLAQRGVERILVWVGLTIATLSLYSLLAIGSTALTALFFALEAASVGIYMVYKSGSSIGAVRHYYRGFAAICGGMMLEAFTAAIPSSFFLSEILTPLFMVLGVVLAFIGYKTTVTNQQAFQEHLQHESNKPQLDTANADPFYAEQPKPDKVKEQR